MTTLLRKFLATFALAASMLVPSAAILAQRPDPSRSEQAKSETVYITRTGKKYHRESCRYLARSKFPISLEDAKTREYTACKVCRPPQ